MINGQAEKKKSISAKQTGFFVLFCLFWPPALKFNHLRSLEGKVFMVNLLKTHKDERGLN